MTPSENQNHAPSDEKSERSTNGSINKSRLRRKLLTSFYIIPGINFFMVAMIFER